MIFNKYKRIINRVRKYYDGEVNTIEYSCEEIESALNYAESRKTQYPQELIEKLRMVKAMVNCP